MTSFLLLFLSQSVHTAVLQCSASSRYGHKQTQLSRRARILTTEAFSKFGIYIFLVAHVDANVMRRFCIVMSMCVVCGVRNTDLPGLRWDGLLCETELCLDSAWAELGCVINCRQCVPMLVLVVRNRVGMRYKLQAGWMSTCDPCFMSRRLVLRQNSFRSAFAWWSSSSLLISSHLISSLLILTHLKTYHLTTRISISPVHTQPHLHFQDSNKKYIGHQNTQYIVWDLMKTTPPNFFLSFPFLMAFQLVLRQNSSDLLRSIRNGCHLSSPPCQNWIV